MRQVEFPDVARFLLHAATYAADVMGKPEEAITALTARLRDVKQNTDEEKEEYAEAEKLLARLNADGAASTAKAEL